MTEAKWLAGTDPTSMLKFLRGRKTSDRSLWLFTVACFRRRWSAFDEQVHRAIEVTTRYADGLATDEEMHVFNTVINAHESACFAVGQSLEGMVGRTGRREESATQADLLREIVGNPFRPVTVDPSWLTTDVRLLSAGIYDDGAFDRMPILADALQDAGCTNDDILNHCRSGGVHVRGCWVLDLLLGKK